MTESIDTTTSMGTFTFHILGALAEFERNLISERTKMGLKHSKKRPGRPKGSKDKRPRKKSGYYLRNKKEKKSPFFSDFL